MLNIQKHSGIHQSRHFDGCHPTRNNPMSIWLLYALRFYSHCSTQQAHRHSNNRLHHASQTIQGHIVDSKGFHLLLCRVSFEREAFAFSLRLY